MPVVSHSPRAEDAKAEMFGFRRWVQRSFVGGNLDDEAPGSMSPKASEGAGGGSFIEPALAEGSGNDLGQDLFVARSLADKFLIHCLLDDSVRPFYTGRSANLGALKLGLTEGFLSAIRSADGGDRHKLSLEAYRGLTEDNIKRLTEIVRRTVLEHCETTRESAPYASTQAFASAFDASSKMPFVLLPKADDSTEAAKAADGMTKRGGEDKAARVTGGIEWAPLTVPFGRRRQMLACVIGTSLIPGCLTILGLSLYHWRKTWPVLLPYLTWALVLDKSPWRGGMKISKWLRRLWIWRRWAEYFPATLIRANPKADFSGERPMLMGYHPHGILSFGVQLCVTTDAAGWSEKFPNLTARPCTLNMNLTTPILREIIGRLGAIPADSGAIRAALKPGNAVLLVVGGAAEALDTKPGEYVLTLARRNGFFRIALQHGADLVPTFGFGENDLFDIVQPSSLVRAIQLKAYKILSFSMPIFYGRGVFTYNMGLLPFRRPLTVVVGDPIRTEKTENPTVEQIDALKEKYIEALRQLHKDWAPRLEPGRDTSLMIL